MDLCKTTENEKRKNLHDKKKKENAEESFFFQNTKKSFIFVKNVIEKNFFN